jgi:presenilin-like A22 family membrane protease
MKHNWKITLILLAFFLVAQFIGIAGMYNYIDTEKSQQEGKTIFKDLPTGERPQMDEKYSFIPITLAVLIGTIFLLLLIKYNLSWVWKIWFLLAVFLALTISFSAFINTKIALFLALTFSIWKIFRPNFYVHNLTELFIYGGLAIIFAPLFNLVSVIILLIIISIYDAYAVWKSKHMITMAKSQTKAKVFAGLLIPYSLKRAKKKTKTKLKKVKTAILGGGDIAFPLIFAGVILKEFGLWQSLIIPFFAGLGLLYLLLTGDNKKFYPAMPFISAGCFLGLGVIALISIL